MKNPIKWGVNVTARSMDATTTYDSAPAVIINWTFGIFTAISGFLSVLFILLSAMASVATLNAARITIVMTIVFVMTWLASLKVVEIYLNFINKE